MNFFLYESPNIFIYIFTTVNDVAKTINDKPQNEPTVKRGRKPKQTVLNEFFLVQNEASTSKSFDLSLHDSSSIAKDTTVKSSRYGRVIKPKSYDLEIPAKIKLERRSSKDAIDSTILVQSTTAANPTNAPNAVVQPPKKRDRQKMSEPVNISVYKNSIINASEEGNIPLSFDNIDECSDALKLLSAQRKSAERYLAQHITSAFDHTQSSSNEQISIDETMNEQIILPKKTESHGRGRPSKNAAKKALVNVNQNPAFDEQLTNEFSIANFVDVNEPTASNMVEPKRRGRPSENSNMEDSSVLSTSNNPIVVKMESKRLAIIALPDTHGNVNIISLPENIPKAKNNGPTMIKVKIDIKLRLGFNVTENNAQTITQLTWSRVKGHKVLCAGYNTGLIAIWNFDHLNLSHMCKKDARDGMPALVPQYTFLGALSFITQLDLHSDNEDCVRWVLVGALDRRVRLYDLHDPQLVPYTSQVFKSRIITGTWPVHWPIHLTIIDAALTRMNGDLHIKPVLYTDNQPRSTNLCIDCEPSNLSFSDWLNTGIFGTDAGDLIMINFQQLLLHDRYDESSEQKIVCSTDVFHEEQPITSEESGSDEQFKVLFNDFDEIDLAPKMELRIAPMDQYPYARITRTAINPNESHQKLYAIGYELGFCRIHFMP